MITLFISAFILGLIFNAAPGAVFAETVRQGVRGGFRPALAVQIGSLVGDALWAVLGLVGIGLLLQLEALRWPVGIAGAAYLLYLAWDSWKAASQEFSVNTSDGMSEKSNDAQAREKSALRSGILLSVTNPQNVAYWAAMGSALGAVGISQPSAADYMLFFAGFMASSVLWCFVCAGLVDRVFRRAGMRWARLTYKLCAIAFVVLALNSLRDLFKPRNAMTDTAVPALIQKL
jgi:chemosensory pili system protein ChpE